MKSQEDIKAAITLLESQITICREAVDHYTAVGASDADICKFWTALESDYMQRLISLEWVMGIRNDGII